MALFISTQLVLADVVTTKRRVQPLTSQTESNRQLSKSKNGKFVKLANNVKSCKKYSETLDSDISGVNFNFKIDILGWVDNKCRVDFVANSTGLSEMFSSLYGVDPSMVTIQSFEPKISCGFTKKQLETVGDSILQEEERANDGSVRMLKDPSLIEMPTLSNMSGSDIELMNVILKDGACNILNAPDSNQMFESLFGY